MSPTWVLQLGQYGLVAITLGLVAWVIVSVYGKRKQPDFVKIISDNTAAFVSNAEAVKELVQVVRQQGELIQDLRLELKIEAAKREGRSEVK